MPSKECYLCGFKTISAREKTFKLIKNINACNPKEIFEFYVHPSCVLDNSLKPKIK